jgi:citrate synthase
MRIPTQVFEMLKLAPPSANPMVILRTAISAMGMFDLDGGINTEEANARKARRILAQVATIVSALCRCRAGLPVLSPDTNMGFAANFLYMLHGKEPSLLAAKAMDMLMVLHADHGLAASTFAARVTVSTLAGMHSAITAALASLKGPLHGGANRKVMEMLEEIGEPKDVEEYIESLLNSGQRIMGFGHRIYKTEDPRSRHLKQISEKLCPLSGMERMIETSQRIEKTVHERKGIFPNVDFYSATVQKALELPMDFYVCIFAMARTAGWIAHIMEQFDDNRLIRPTSNYIGGFYRKLNPI